MKSVLALYRGVVKNFPPGGSRFLNVYAWLLASLAVFDAAALGLLALCIGPLAIGQPVVLPFIGKLNVVGVVWAVLVICAVMVAKGAFAVLITWWARERLLVTKSL